ncbi:uncharacterized protein LOC131311783 [Rhododendron vialii]|uniref:uncharacterized protein LOC131311783 n=1 Tax=Rhododendron vialii TaxID=182163 RepID=UPI00265E8425|nr:uncharacterized protein LOC131311783 [Rhododendron vialii]
MLGIFPDMLLSLLDHLCWTAVSQWRGLKDMQSLPLMITTNVMSRIWLVLVLPLSTSRPLWKLFRVRKPSSLSHLNCNPIYSKVKRWRSCFLIVCQDGVEDFLVVKWNSCF